jgi:hypothetical protein
MSDIEEDINERKNEESGELLEKAENPSVIPTSDPIRPKGTENETSASQTSFVSLPMPEEQLRSLRLVEVYQIFNIDVSFLTIFSFPFLF